MYDREVEMLDLYKIHAYLPHDAENNPLTPFGNFAKGYELAWQARGERIKELEAEILGWKGKSIEREQHLQIANSAVEELTAKLNKARKALKFYADRKNWHKDSQQFGSFEVSDFNIIYNDFYEQNQATRYAGNIAKQALEELDK